MSSPVWKPYPAQASTWPAQTAFLTGTLRYFSIAAQSENILHAPLTAMPKGRGETE
jgi:hypothetical protein